MVIMIIVVLLYMIIFIYKQLCFLKMSVTVSSCQQINHSPLNHSSAKQLWSFPKSDRFKQDQPSICSQAFYNLPDSKDKRKAGIGYGKKLDITRGKSMAPAPSAYIIKSDFELAANKKKGFPFGLSREAMASTGSMGSINQWSPAPGKYNLGNTLSNLKYTMRPKLASQFNLGKSGVPGPGTYAALPALNEKGRYVVSNFHNSCASLINPARSLRFDKTNSSFAPGPGAYKMDQTGMAKDGRYFISKLENSKCRSFPHEMRNTGSVGASAKVPGPGSYRLPSEFGYYEAKKQN